MQIHRIDITRTTIARGLFPLIVFGLCILILFERASGDFWSELPDFLKSVPWQVWIAGLACTGISFFALGQYDDLAHRHMGTGIAPRDTRLSGMTAISLGQTIGFGMLSGAVCRWRMLPGLSALRAVKLSAFVSVSFIMSLGILTAFACLILPTPQGTQLSAMSVLLVVPFIVFALLCRPNMTLFGANIRLPSALVAFGIFKWTIVDTLAATVALWVFLPSGIEIPLLHFFPVYLIALVSAVLCNTPGGVGPFDLAVLSFFPNVEADILLQSIIAFRVVYYALPACIGTLMLLRPLGSHQHMICPDFRFDDLEAAPRSEVGVIVQNGGRIMATRDGAAAFWPTSQTITSLFSPVSGSISAALQAVKCEARQHGKIPFIYKCTAREAIAVRRHGWHVAHVADDALLCPKAFSLNISSRRGLRRKLRTAHKAGVTICREEALPIQEMRSIDAEWRSIRGPVRGGTLGRFCERYVSKQWVAIARVNGVPVAFVTLFTSRQEWCVDLMRHGSNAPNGTMHALIYYALETARSEGIATLSLAAVPPRRPPKSLALRHLHRRFMAGSQISGLTRFKSSFSPRWAPRYAASMHRTGLALGLIDIALEVHNSPAKKPQVNFPPDHQTVALSRDL